VITKERLGLFSLALFLFFLHIVSAGTEQPGLESQSTAIVLAVGSSIP
jgi:hypothetical protein